MIQRFLRGAVVAAVMVLVLALRAAPTEADPGASPGGQLYATGGTITVTVEGYDAKYISDLWLFSPVTVPLGIANTQVGNTVTLPAFPAGAELVFGIVVRETGATFVTGPAHRNADDRVHATTTAVGTTGVLVGFEDQRGGGDRDYNDLVFRFVGEIVTPGGGGGSSDDGSVVVRPPAGGGGSGGSGGGGSAGSGGGSTGGAGGGGGGGGSSSSTCSLVVGRVPVPATFAPPEGGTSIAAYEIGCTLPAASVASGAIVSYLCPATTADCTSLEVYYRRTGADSFARLISSLGPEGKLSFLVPGAGVFVIVELRDPAVCAPEGGFISGGIPLAGGFGLAMFCDGSSAELIAASGCPLVTATFWVTNPLGDFVIYAPGANVPLVNAPWNAMFPGGMLPGVSVLIGKCQ